MHSPVFKRVCCASNMLVVERREDLGSADDFPLKVSVVTSRCCLRKLESESESCRQTEHELVLLCPDKDFALL